MRAPQEGVQRAGLSGGESGDYSCIDRAHVAQGAPRHISASRRQVEIDPASVDPALPPLYEAMPLHRAYNDTSVRVSISQRPAQFALCDPFAPVENAQREPDPQWNSVLGNPLFYLGGEQKACVANQEIQAFRQVDFRRFPCTFTHDRSKERAEVARHEDALVEVDRAP